MQRSSSEVGFGKSSLMSHKISEKNKHGCKHTLPLDFMKQIHQLEEKLADQLISMLDLNKLLALYTKGVEFYESMNDERYIGFKERITNTLRIPYVVQMMKSKPSERRSMKEGRYQIRHTPRGSATVHFRFQQDPKTEAEKIMQKHRSQLETNRMIIKKDLMKQENALQIKIKQRKGTIKKSYSTSSLQLKGLKSLVKPITKDAEKIADKIDMTNLFGPLIDGEYEVDEGGSELTPEQNILNIESEVQFNSPEPFLKQPKYMSSASPQLNNLEIDTSTNEIDDEEEIEKDVKNIWEQCQSEISRMQEDREKAIEQIVENSTSEKYQRLADVKQKYFPDITRLQEKLTKEPSSMTTKILSKLEAKRDKELKQIQDDVQMKKKAELTRVKKEFEIKRNETVKDSKYKQATEKLRSNLYRRSARVSSTKAASGKGKSFPFSPTAIPKAPMSTRSPNQKVFTFKAEGEDEDLKEEFRDDVVADIYLKQHPSSASPNLEGAGGAKIIGSKGGLGRKGQKLGNRNKLSLSPPKKRETDRSKRISSGGLDIKSLKDKANLEKTMAGINGGKLDGEGAPSGEFQLNIEEGETTTCEPQIYNSPIYEEYEGNDTSTPVLQLTNSKISPSKKPKGLSIETIINE